MSVDWRLDAESPSLVVLMSLVGAGSLLGATPASSAFPGTNGKIAFETFRGGNYEVYVMNSDGTGQANLTNNAADDFSPA